MSVTVGRLSLDDPENFPESVGESVANVGATPVPGGRAGLTHSIALTSFPASSGDTATDRQRVRRQLRSLVNNLPYRLQGVYVAWTEDTERSGWYVPGKADFDVADISGLVSAYWKLSLGELREVGKRRTHRRATSVYIRSLLDGTVPRDYLKRVYSTNFSDQTPVALTHLPSTVTDYRFEDGSAIPTLTTARTGYGSSSLQAVIGGTNLQVVSYEQDEANRNLGDVVIYDRRGTLTLTTTGPTTGWEEVYGPDWPLTSGDAPVLENSLARVSYDTSNTDGFVVERWIGSTWSHEGKVLVKRITTGGTYDTTFVSADIMEWTPERGVVRAVMSVSGDAASREEVYLTLQRGWTGPRVEVYPAKTSAGANANAGIAFYASVTPAGTSYARKEDDAGLQTATGTTGFSNATLGSATGFNDENWLAFHPNGGGAGAGTTQVNIAVVQSDVVAKTYSDTNAYGSTRNGVGVEGGTAYASIHIGFVTATGGTLNENSSTTRLGSQDMAASILYDSRSVPTVVSRSSR